VVGDRVFRCLVECRALVHVFESIHIVLFRYKDIIVFQDHDHNCLSKNNFFFPYYIFFILLYINAAFTR
jgi:hypothetical protein